MDNLVENKVATAKDTQHNLIHSTIMMVDDEPINMHVVKSFLEEEGYSQFILVENSTEAVKTLEEKRPDVLLLDLVMPEVSGFDILSEVRSHPKLKHLPVIILTASTDTKTKLDALELGATDFLAKPVDSSELRLRVRNTLAAKAYLDQLAYYDSLTKLPNRQLFLERCEWTLKQAKRHKNHFALLQIELDNFSRISDTVGLSAGDQILCELTSRIQKMIRETDVLGHVSDNTEDEMQLFRFSGSVFSLLLDHITNADDAAHVAERLLQIIREPMHLEKIDLFVTASVGIAVYPMENVEFDTLLHLASSAKDYAKNKGGDTFQFSSESINSMYAKRLSIETKLLKALEGNEFILHYQPKVDVDTNVIQGVEALVRWQEEDGKLVPPNDFIPLAEETGLIVPIGEWVMREACSTLKRWLHDGCTPISMSINISVKQIQQPNFIALVKRIVDESALDPQLLKLEITESLLMDDIEEKIEILHSLKNMDLKISIDDFGTGFSSLSYLRNFPVDELKIDMSFMRNIPDNAHNCAIASTIIFLANNFRLLTVAEGVETQEQINFLRKQKCDQYQGFVFSRPLPDEEIFKLLPKK